MYNIFFCCLHSPGKKQQITQCMGRKQNCVYKTNFYVKLLDFILYNVSYFQMYFCTLYHPQWIIWYIIFCTTVDILFAYFCCINVMESNVLNVLLKINNLSVLSIKKNKKNKTNTVMSNAHCIHLFIQSNLPTTGLREAVRLSTTVIPLGKELFCMYVMDFLTPSNG